MSVADGMLEWVAQKLPSGHQAELYVCRDRERAIDIREGRLEVLQESVDSGVGLRVLSRGRIAFAHAAGLGLEGLGELLPQVLSQLPHLPEDGCRAFASSAPEAVAEATEGWADPALLRLPLQEQLPRLRELEAMILSADPRVKRVLRVGYGESFGETAIVNTLGLRRTREGTQCSVGAAAVAEKGASVQVGSASGSARFYRGLDFGRVAREAAFRAGALVDSIKPATARRAVVFDPWVAPEFLGLLATSLQADEIQKGKSMFRGKQGARVASAAVHVDDDPLLPRGLASAAFDDEGVPTRGKTLIGEGILRERLYDTYTARKEGRDSNGSAGRASYKDVPGPCASNFFMRPGAVTRERLLGGTRDGVLILEVMGMHTADPVSGEFSVGIAGVAIEDGELTRGVRGAMLSGSLQELLERVDAVADDLTFYGAMAAPTFRAADMMVA